MVVDLQLAGVPAPDLEQFALPQLCVSRGAPGRRGAQCNVVLCDDSEHAHRDGGDGGHHCAPVATASPPCPFGASPISPEAMNRPSVPAGAMITRTLSESLSATVFWISSGCRLSSSPSRAIWSALALPTLSSRYTSASASFTRESASPSASILRA